MKIIGTVLAAATLYINAPAPVAAAPGPLFSAVLPTSRSVQVGQSATAFATILNAGSDSASGCRIAPLTSVAATFFYQTTDPVTNALAGTVNTPVTIAAGAGQSFAFGLTPTAPLPPTTVRLEFVCDNAASADSVTGLNTLLLVADPNPVPDIVALSATRANDGVMRATPSGVFAVAVSNVGASGTIDVSTDTGSTVLPLTIALCQTDPATSNCVNPPAPTTGHVTLSIAGGATPTFGVFVTRSATFQFDPANNRIFVRFRDNAGGVDRGATSVAVDDHLPASFSGLGNLGGFPYSRAFGISADGSVVVGDSVSASGSEAFRWTAKDGMLGLGDLPNGIFDSSARGASADGSVIVGTGRSDIGEEPFRWTLANGMEGLGRFPADTCTNCQRAGKGVSADGSVVVGHGTGLLNFEAFRWTALDGMVELGTLAGTVQSFAEAVSADGTIVVGETNSEAFRWTAATGMVGLGGLESPGGYRSSSAVGISADGTVIVGYAQNSSAKVEAFRWTSAGMEGLGFPAGPAAQDAMGRSFADDASADGSVVVGWSGSIGHEDAAFIWDRSHGIRDLQTVLVNDYQVDLSGWTLEEATAISDDGKTIVGFGTNPNGGTEAWIVHIGS